MKIIPFHTGSATKTPIIQNLQSAFEHEEISILADEVTINELSAYEAKKTASGYSYNAPAGMHDDTVMALAIGWDAIRGSVIQDLGNLGSIDNFESRWSE